MLREVEDKEKWEYVVKGVEAIRRLKPDKVGLKDTILEAGRTALNALGVVVIAAPAYVLGGAFLALALVTLAGSSEVAHAIDRGLKHHPLPWALLLYHRVCG